jgi:hypothetical protein
LDFTLRIERKITNRTTYGTASVKLTVQM